jgi:hypothetical protein
MIQRVVHCWLRLAFNTLLSLPHSSCVASRVDNEVDQAKSLLRFALQTRDATILHSTMCQIRATYAAEVHIRINDDLAYALKCLEDMILTSNPPPSVPVASATAALPIISAKPVASESRPELYESLLSCATHFQLAKGMLHAWRTHVKLQNERRERFFRDNAACLLKE